MSEQSAQIERIIDGLQQQFAVSRVVWWEDPLGEFSETLEALTLQNVQVLRRSVTPALAIKQQVELLNPSGLFLIYEDSNRPEPEQDWLLDIRLYAAPFAADRTSMLLQELGLRQHSLREHLKAFSENEWIDVLLRSTGMEPAHFNERTKWHLLTRMIAFVENNYNCCELGPRGTGKSHIYKEVSPNSILVSGGQTTVANLFYNMSRRQVGLVGMWDVVAFDEVAGISFKDKDGVQIMKDYMASGSFARGRDSISASASMMFVGNINQPVDTLVKTSHLLAPFPSAMIDSAFFDRFHAYIPGWEVPKMRPEFFTNRYGLITDYLAEFMREMRKRNFADAIDRFFKLGNNLNQRDTIAVRRTVSGLLKLLHPSADYDREAVRRCLEYALETRRRVKEQLKKIGGMEFFDVHFSYIDADTLEETFISVPEQGGGGLIPEGQGKPGTMHLVSTGANGHLGAYFGPP